MQFALCWERGGDALCLENDSIDVKMQTRVQHLAQAAAATAHICETISRATASTKMRWSTVSDPVTLLTVGFCCVQLSSLQVGSYRPLGL